LKILGISAYYHDAAAALIVNGKIVTAIQEERFTRKKSNWISREHIYSPDDLRNVW
jgi:predicted NodU family carbamoyl transferase